jgi:aspartate/methionine/tyrosine aminotransferase
MSNRPELQLSERVRSIPEALSIYMNQLVYDLKRRGQDITTLSLGEAFFDIPLFDFRKLDLSKAYHYSDTQGIPELRHKIAQFYKMQYGAQIDADKELMITAGSKAAIFMSMQATLNSGDEVLIHEPAWLSYEEQARLVGARPRFIPFGCLVKDFGAHFSDRTRMLVINNPNNPAGRRYDRTELETLYTLCRDRGVYLLVDEAYSDFVIDEPFTSLCSIAPDKDGIIVVNSLSKNMGMSGWRVGYVVTHPQLLTQLIKLNQHLITCAPSILLYYLARYFDQITEVTLPQVRQVVAKRSRVSAMLDELGLSKLGGESTFYFFISIADFPGTSLDFALELLVNHAISVVPGLAYGDSTDRFVRVGVGTESEERIWTALCVIRDLIETGQYDRQALDAKLYEFGFQRFVEPVRA